MDEFAWTRQQAILYNNIIGGVNAVLMAFYFIIIAYISKWYICGEFTLFYYTVHFSSGCSTG